MHSIVILRIETKRLLLSLFNLPHLQENLFKHLFEVTSSELTLLLLVCNAIFGQIKVFTPNFYILRLITPSTSRPPTNYHTDRDGAIMMVLVLVSEFLTILSRAGRSFFAFSV